MKRVIAMIGGLVLVAISHAGVATAEPYGPGACSLGLSVTVAHPGDPVTATVVNAPPNVTLPFTFVSTPVNLGSAQTDASGKASLTFNVPSDAEPGIHHVLTTCAGAPLSAELTVVEATTIVTTPVRVPSKLPLTGGDIVGLVIVGLALLLVGTYTVIRTRRRQAVG